MRRLIVLISTAPTLIGELPQQSLQMVCGVQQFMVTLRAFRVLAAKFLVNEILHGGNVSVGVTHPAPNKATTAFDLNRRFRRTKKAFDRWCGLAVAMLTVANVVDHECFSFREICASITRAVIYFG